MASRIITATILAVVTLETVKTWYQSAQRFGAYWASSPGGAEATATLQSIIDGREVVCEDTGGRTGTASWPSARPVEG